MGCEHRAVGKLGAPKTRGTYVSVIRLKLPTSIKSLAPKSRRGARRAGSTAARAAASWRSSQWRPPTQNPSESAVSSSACCSDASRPILDIRDRPRGARRPRSPKALLRPCAAAVTKTKARRKPNEPSLRGVFAIKLPWTFALMDAAGSCGRSQNPVRLAQLV